MLVQTTETNQLFAKTRDDDSAVRSTRRSQFAGGKGMWHSDALPITRDVARGRPKADDICIWFGWVLEY